MGDAAREVLPKMLADGVDAGAEHVGGAMGAVIRKRYIDIAKDVHNSQALLAEHHEIPFAHGALEIAAQRDGPVQGGRLEKGIDPRGRTKSRRTGLDDAALQANVSGDTAQKVKQMRALVVHQAKRELLVPLGKPAPGISELHGAHATKRADRSVGHIAQEAFGGTRELKIVNNGEPKVLQPGKGRHFFSLGHRHRKRFFG